MEELINLNQGGISVLANYLKFNKFSMFFPSLVSNPSDDMSHFITDDSDD